MKADLVGVKKTEHWSFGIVLAGKRSFGLLVDWLIVSALCLAPFFIHSLTNPEFARKFKTVFDISGNLSSPMAAVVLLVFSAFTPIPLINLRILCKVIWRVPTPGELLSGYSAKSRRSGAMALLNEIGYGSLQYGLLWISNSYVLPAMLINVIITLVRNPADSAYSSSYLLQMAVSFIFWGLFFSMNVFWPRSKAELRGLLEFMSDHSLVEVSRKGLLLPAAPVVDDGAT